MADGAIAAFAPSRTAPKRYLRRLPAAMEARGSHPAGLWRWLPIAAITGRGRGAWWFSTATGSAAKGGLFDFCDMQVIAAEPNKLVHWRCTRGPDEWLNTEVTFRLDWKEDQTFVVFKHANWKEPVEFMHHCSTK